MKTTRDDRAHVRNFAAGGHLKALDDIDELLAVIYELRVQLMAHMGKDCSMCRAKDLIVETRVYEGQRLATPPPPRTSPNDQ